MSSISTRPTKFQSAGLRSKGTAQRPGAGWVALLVAGIFAAVTPAHAQTYGAQVSSYSTNKFLSSTWWPVTLRVKNIGLSGKITVLSSAAPYGWTVKAAEGDSETEVTHFIAQGSKEDFQFQVKASDYEVTGNITWEIWGIDTEWLPIQLLVTDQEVQTVYPPGSFQLVNPALAQSDVETSPIFQWTSSSGAEQYYLELFTDVHGNAATTPFFTSPLQQATSLQYSGSEFLSYSERYWWQVTAKNAYSQTLNDNGKYSFTIRPIPLLSAFSIYSPTANGKYDPLPQVWWSGSANADKYGIKVYEDAGGAPAATPIFPEQFVTSTSWNWEKVAAPAKGKWYYVQVTAYGSSPYVPPVKAANSPVHFLYSGLSYFEYIAPIPEQTGVSQNPVFQWQGSAGAHGYRVEIRGDDVMNFAYRFSDTVTEKTFYSYTGSPLTPNAKYLWTVYALGTGEELICSSGYMRFYTMDVRPFLLLTPTYGEKGVDPEPTFTWTPVGGKNVNQLFLEVWKDNENVPGELVKVHASPGLPSTTTSYTYKNIFPLDRGRRYYWQIAARSNSGYDRYNEEGLRTFETISLGDFTLTSPQDGSTSITRTPTFTWQPSANAERYSISIWITDASLQPKGYPIIAIGDIPGASTQYRYAGSPILTGETWFAWQAYAWQGDRWLSSVSSIRRFRTQPSENPGAGGEGVKEHILGQGFLVGPGAAAQGDANADGVIDIGDLVKWADESGQ